MSLTLAVTITPRSINLLLDGRPRAIDNSHPNFDALKAELQRGAKAKDYNLDLIRDLADLPGFITRASFGRVQVGDSEVRFDGIAIEGVYVTQVLTLLKGGYSIDALANYLAKREQNPSVKARQEIDLFLESGQFVLTDDGDILAFKKVADDYTSFHRGYGGEVVSNKIGEKPSMRREDVDPNRNATCSRGLHFCSYSYLDHYHGGQGRVVIVKINPADVVSIPSDYNNAKGRAWTYEVVGEVPEDEAKSYFGGVATASEDYYRRTLEDGDGDTQEEIDRKLAEYGPVPKGFDIDQARIVVDSTNDNGDRLDALQAAFDWEDTIQGWSYWDDADTSLNNEVEPDDALPVLEFWIAQVERAEAAAATAAPEADAEDARTELTEEERLELYGDVPGDLKRADLERALDTSLSFRKRARGLLYAFEWVSTVQGDEYWEPHHDQLEAGVELAEEPRAILEFWLRRDSQEDAVDTVETALVFKTKDGRQFTADEVTKIVDEHGYRGGQRISGISESTLRGWIKEIRG